MAHDEYAGVRANARADVKASVIGLEEKRSNGFASVNRRVSRRRRMHVLVGFT